MLTLQKTGPFKGGVEQIIEVNGTICHIGLELGRTMPFFHYENMLEPIFKVNNVEYTINDTCTLEWGDIATRYVAITPLKDLDEYTIIDIAYE